MVFNNIKLDENTEESNCASAAHQHFFSNVMENFNSLSFKAVDRDQSNLHLDDEDCPYFKNPFQDSMFMSMSSPPQSPKLRSEQVIEYQKNFQKQSSEVKPQPQKPVLEISTPVVDRSKNNYRFPPMSMPRSCFQHVHRESSPSSSESS